MRRRVVLTGAAGIGVAAAVAAGGARFVDVRSGGGLPSAARVGFGDLGRLLGADGGDKPVVPDAPVGDERLERLVSAARGRSVDVYTCVPAGHGDGRGLPVCLVLHGGSKTVRDFPAMGLGRFLTAAVAQGAPPFVLAGAAGDRLGWRPSGADDPQRMVREEVPRWCAGRGFDTTRIAMWGWSMGGAGALLLAEAFPGFARAVAAFSPAVAPGDAVFAGRDRLRGTPVGLWCGRDDPLYPDVRALHRKLPEAPVAGSYTGGRHNFGYWSTVVPAAFAFVAGRLT
ncbi:alpha/beta hydrolase-fold protein [Dactylosporangium sp. NPDC049742]|uniref:alpha/beta hydrolase n=1 Tax=Dactylosporangium sp. NPDC049742 TaxID=3154737 RepID=UPI0034170764